MKAPSEPPQLAQPGTDWHPPPRGAWSWRCVSIITALLLVEPLVLLSGPMESIKRFAPLAAPPAIGAPHSTAIRGRLHQIASSVRGEARPTRSDPSEGSICVFVYANVGDDDHRAEFRTALETWAVGFPLFVFTDRGDEIAPMIGSHPTARLITFDPRNWSQMVGKVVQGTGDTHPLGRGHMIHALHVLWKERGQELFPQCDWFLKCDTDSYLNHPMLTRQLRGYDAKKAYYFGTFAPMDRGTALKRKVNHFALGGPGYALSRKLLQLLPLEQCHQFFDEHPRWWANEDVALGHCIEHFMDPEAVILKPHVAVAAASKEATVEALIRRSIKTKRTYCLTCAQAIHPLGPEMMEVVHRLVTESRTDPPALADCVGCVFRNLIGSPHLSTTGRWAFPPPGRR